MLYIIIYHDVIMYMLVRFSCVYIFSNIYIYIYTYIHGKYMLRTKRKWIYKWIQSTQGILGFDSSIKIPFTVSDESFDQPLLHPQNVAAKASEKLPPAKAKGKRLAKNVFQPKNHRISKLVVWRSQTPAMHIQSPL